MRSGLTGGCSSMAGVAFGTILSLIGDPHVGQGSGFLVSSPNFSLLTVEPTFVFMRSRPPCLADQSYSPHTGEKDSAIPRSDAFNGCYQLRFEPVSEPATLSQVNGRGRNRWTGKPRAVPWLEGTRLPFVSSNQDLSLPSLNLWGFPVSLTQIQVRSGVRIDTCSSHPYLLWSRNPVPGRLGNQKSLARIQTGPRWARYPTGGVPGRENAYFTSSSA